MKERILLTLSLILIAASFAFAQTGRRTVTNADLEKYKEKRVQAEADYRANYKRRGMPSPEELKRQEAERQAWLAEYSRQAETENRQTADYFLSQANQIKSEISGAQAQINYLRRQIGNLPERNSVFLRPEQICSVGVVPYGYFPRVGSFYSQQNSIVAQTPNAQVAINSAASMPNPYAGTSLERSGVKVVIGNQPNWDRRGRRGYYRPRFYGGYVSTCGVNDNSAQRDDLVSRLSYLEQTKAGLYARLELLREEARRAGVRID